MSDESSKPENGLPEKINPNDIPMEDRRATLLVVWTKDNKLFMTSPGETHLTLKMLSAVFDILAQKEVENKAKMAATMGRKEPGIIPARSIPAFDPRFLNKKPH